jgi:hypothetical protein
MPDTESAMYVPLRSNAKTLVTGQPIAVLRRRLKYASVFHDKLILQSGILRMQAGAGGSSSFISAANPADPPRWQTPRDRHLAGQSPFQISMGRESSYGVPAEALKPVLVSDTAISWTATLHPFARELPADAGWVHFGQFSKPGPSVDRLAQRWTWADQRNPQLESAIPGRFVRSAVIKNVNDDLATAVAAGCTTTIDALHAQVVAQRFQDGDGWRLNGYTIPILFPQVGDWDWDAIVDLRRDRNMERFRAELREIEDEAAAEAVGGDIEAAARHAYERHLAKAVPALTGIGAVTLDTVINLVIGGVAGFATIGIKGPAGPIAGAGIGVVPSVVTDIRDMVRQRRSRGWVAVRNRIAGD